MFFLKCDFDISFIKSWGLCSLQFNLSGLVTMEQLILCEFQGQNIKGDRVSTL